MHTWLPFELSPRKLFEGLNFFRPSFEVSSSKVIQFGVNNRNCTQHYKETRLTLVQISEMSTYLEIDPSPFQQKSFLEIFTF